MTTVSQIINDYNAGEIILLHISDYDIFCEACFFISLLDGNRGT